MNNKNIMKILKSPQKLELTVVAKRDPVDESGYIRYSEPVIHMDDETTRYLLKLALMGLESTQESE